MTGRFRAVGAAAMMVAALAASGCSAPTAAVGADPQKLLLIAAAAGALTPTQSCQPAAPVGGPGGPETGVVGQDPAAGPAAGTGVPEGGWPVLQGTGAVLLVRAAKTTPWGNDQQQLLTAVMVGMAESSGNPRAGNRLSDGRTHQGLWQISSLHQGLISKYGDRYNPAANAHMAYDLWKAAYDRNPSNPWQPWEAYTAGHYLKHEAAARAAIAEVNVGTVSEEAHADLGSDPCVPNDQGATGAEVVGGDTSVPCTAGGGRIEATPTGEQIRVCSVPSAPSIVVDARIASNVERLVVDAKAEGLTIGGSGFRSNKRQAELFAQNCRGGRCSPPTAKPGKSQHEYGLAVDLTCNGSLIRSRSNPCYEFITRTGGKPGGQQSAYGLINLGSEPWHHSTTGR